MSLDPRHYDVILSPVITEKATMASENGAVVFKVANDASKPEIKAEGWSRCTMEIELADYYPSLIYAPLLAMAFR